jgi:hypothetical protein
VIFTKSSPQSTFVIGSKKDTVRFVKIVFLHPKHGSDNRQNKI